MDRDVAIESLGRLHEAQGAFYAGGSAAPLRELLTNDVVWRVPVEQTWSTVGLYRFRDNRIAACWLIPLNAGEFDRIWGEILRD